MNVFKIVFALMLGIFANNAQANWEYMELMGNEFKLYYNTDSLHTVQTFQGKQYQQAWFKQELVNDLDHYDQLAVGDYVLNLWRFNCLTRQVGLVKSLKYKQNGEFLGQNHRLIVLLSDIIPDTTGAVMWNKVCVVSANDELTTDSALEPVTN